MASDPVITIAQGTLQGSSAGGVASFKGIPYAAAPYGELRFQAPAPPPHWEGIRDATRYGPTPPKVPYPRPIDEILPEPFIEGEEILNLNIWTPEGGSDLPVFVWIHGGSFTNGTGAVSAYDGTKFARDGVVCVTINYRLGADGFLLIDGTPPNRGLLDQVAALRWVQQNIAAFGGDPARVTIGGESAGAMSVTTLLAMPSAEGLFSRAITQSGAGHHTHSLESARKVTALLAERLGVEPTFAGFDGVPVAELVAAAARTAAKIVTSPDAAYWGEVQFNRLPFEPVVDGETLPRTPIDALAAGASANVTLLTGSNLDEQTLFMVPTGLAAAINEDALHFLLGAHGLDGPRTAELYRRDRPEATPGEIFIAAYTDWFFRIPAIRAAEARSGAAAATYMYEFAWPSPLFDGRLKAAHALEVGFVFDNLDDPNTSAAVGDNPPQSVADAMHGDWVRFIRTGSPGWEPYGQSRAVRVYDEKVTDVSDPRSAEREVWDGVR